ncbi:Transposon TX1 uncharacterized 149 kDa protein [Vitis vinifera]|uniref:Transposon TX1 uncharacterized 149 kDa protein n=1 Tax=Vitis vinifera TaxID=29760 RepID=A0A438JBC5_VITVI|nr:Transposon TX1 uncharacterized 149 kDa protein [Vitis vinifera]
MLGPTAGSNIELTPDTVEARSDWAQFGAKDFGPLAGPAYKGSSNGSPDASSSSKLLRPGFTAKNIMSKEEASSTPKRNLEGGGSPETNQDTFRGKSHSRKSDLSTGFETSKAFTGEQREKRGFCNANWSISYVVQRGSFFISPVVNISHRGGASCLEGEASFPVLEPSTLPLEGFQVEGLTPRKMVKVQSVLESLRIRIVRDNGKGVEGENKSALSADKILSWNTRGLGSRKKRRTVRRFLSTQNPDVVMLQDKEISEKMGDSSLTVNMRCFDEFIRESGLLDPPLRNAAFTWSNMQVDPICKRLDRFLFSSEWDSFFSQSIQEALPRWTSDHSPICLETNPLKWGLAPFRVATGRRSRKFIKSLISERGETLNNIEIIFEEIVNFFGNLYSKPEGDSWKIEGIDWAPISRESAIWLDRPFSEKEVRMAVFQLNKEKAPGPDGFTIAVYQECWDVIKEDLMRVRLRKVLHETIFGSQGAFVEGRQILDAVLIANEVVDEKRRSGEEGVVFKIDFEKAYDHVDWGFLDHVLQRKGFSQKWRSWMRGCLSSSSFAILVNGNAKGWVKASRGLRQGDPLSPFLFTLVADVLSRLMIRAEETRITEDFLVGRDRTRVSLLQFADDTIFFSKPLWTFFKTSRLSFWFLGKMSEWPLSYLGLPLGGNPKTIGFGIQWLREFSKRLDGWMEKGLFVFGMEDYFNSGREGKKDHLIRWEVVSRPKEMGGLGFGKTSMRNIALLGNGSGGSLEKGAVFGIRCPWKAIAQVFQFSPFVRLVVGNGREFGFEKIFGGETKLCALNLLDLYRVISVKKPHCLKMSLAIPYHCLEILTFAANLTDSEIDLLQRLMSSLNSVLFSPSSSDSKAWSLSSSGSFSVKSFFCALSKVSNPLMFLPAKFLWSSKVPSKVKALAWLVAHGKVNTNDKFAIEKTLQSPLSSMVHSLQRKWRVD